jgi:two-component sensor histidine kinase
VSIDLAAMLGHARELQAAMTLVELEDITRRALRDQLDAARLRVRISDDGAAAPAGAEPAAVLATVPLTVDDQVLGTLHVTADEPAGAGREPRELLDALAPQVAAALKRVRDHEERVRTEAARAHQNRITEMIATNAALPDILVELTRMIEAHAPGSLGSILLLDDDGVHIRHGAAPSLPRRYTEQIDGVPIGPKAGSCGTAMYLRRQIIVSDIDSDPLWEDYKVVALPFGLRACWSTPIVGSEGKVLGSFAMYYRAPRVPRPAELRLVDEAARLAGIALERRRGDERLRASLQEKEVLLKEIHHRVKNNLQIISSLLALQANQLGSDAHAAAFVESQNRVRAMALVHEDLYRSGDLARIRLAPHLAGLCAHLYRSYAVDPHRIALRLDVADVALTLDHAVPCGLVINELVSNALRHAFPGERTGAITVQLSTVPGGAYRLVVADDGVGLPAAAGRDPAAGTLGLQLVDDLVEQLGGKLTIDRGAHGARFEVTFDGD